MHAASVPGLVVIPGGDASIGSTMNEINQCVEFWGSRLVDCSYNEANFRRWILKEFPRHTVSLKTFLIGKFPVTNGQYKFFLAANSCTIPESIVVNEPDSHPVWGVSYQDALSYCAWLSARTGKRFRLPTEAEWEYAARGPSGRQYPFGDSFDPGKCNTLESGIGHTTAVDFYEGGASEFGVFDLAGNVEEWTIDFYRPYTGGEVIEDDLFHRLGLNYPILRGGSLSRGGDLARSARRHGPFPSPEFRFTGFRVVEDLS